MLVTNETHWTTRSLKRVLIAALRAEGVSFRNYEAEFVFARQHDGVSGLGTYGSPWIRIRIPKPWDMTKPENMKDLARVIVHEIGHNRGLHHNEMGRCRSLEVDWVNGMTLERKKVPVKVRKDKLALRAKQAEAVLERHRVSLEKEKKAVAAWEKKLRLSKQALQARERRLERVAACTPTEVSV